MIVTKRQDRKPGDKRTETVGIAFAPVWFELPTQWPRPQTVMHLVATFLPENLILYCRPAKVERPTAGGRDGGASVVSASSASEALTILPQLQPNLLISDIGMPDEDGYDLIKKVRTLSRTDGGAIPAMALTAFVRSEDRQRALHSGYQMHVAKPVEPSELITVCASWAGRIS